MSKQNQHRPQKGEIRFFGARFKLIEPGKVVRGEPERKPSPITRATSTVTITFIMEIELSFLVYWRGRARCFLGF